MRKKPRTRDTWPIAQPYPVVAVMGKPLPTMDEKMDISEAYRVLLSGTTGIVVYRGGFPAGVITRSDIIEYWMKQKENR